MKIIIGFWFFSAICSVIVGIYNTQMIRMLKKHNRDEYEKAMNPKMSLHETQFPGFMFYTLKGNYMDLKDNKLVKLFNISRALHIVAILSWIMFLGSIQIFE
jgi:hypothetical protein